MKIGSHISLSAPDYLLGAVKEALSYNANALMIYTGAPQNTIRKPIKSFKIDEAIKLMEENDIDIKSLIVHAPYIINLANKIKPETRELAIEFLKKEIKRVEEIGAYYIVLHPGSHVNQGEEIGLQAIVEGLNEVVNEDCKVMILLETMAGKGSELGKTFEEIKFILDRVKNRDKFGVCLDTCHVNDAGYDLNDFDGILDEFDSIVGIENIKVIHINDSKNEKGAKKDRHENIGKGTIGLENLKYVVNHPKLKGVVKILETPWIDGVPPYKEEIELLRQV
ncbi:MAG: deoxyribonuclease IV [Erysipelotrichaceae bacterium]|nr:deoxyribonuclease IV [Erysipelotrichaceae bacterium]